jgi:hypothetical protein
MVVLMAVVSSFTFSLPISAAECPKNAPRDQYGRPLDKNCWTQQQRQGVVFPGVGSFGGGQGGGVGSGGGSQNAGVSGTTSNSGRYGILGGGGKSGKKK